MADEELPERIGAYRVLARLGQGGMGEVLLAEAEGVAGVSKRVVIKRIRWRLGTSENAVALFLREARALARLRHGNVVQVYELGEEDGEYHLVMEHLDGASMRELARRNWAAGRPLPLEAVLRVVGDAALGLDHAHALVDGDGQPLPLVHRDVSPDNIMLCRDGVARVVDFGLAKTMEEEDDLTGSSILRGKVAYMSPEQLQGEPLDGRSDIFSLGVSLYWLTTGRAAFRGRTDAMTVNNILGRDPIAPHERNPEVPEAVDRLILDMMEKDPDDRPQTAGEVHDRLLDVVGELSRALGEPRSPLEVVRQAAALVEDTLALPDASHTALPDRTFVPCRIIDVADVITGPTQVSPAPMSAVTTAAAHPAVTVLDDEDLHAANTQPARASPGRPPSAHAAPADKPTVTSPVPAPRVAERTVAPTRRPVTLPLALAALLALLGVGAAVGVALVGEDEPASPAAAVTTRALATTTTATPPPTAPVGDDGPVEAPTGGHEAPTGPDAQAERDSDGDDIADDGARAPARNPPRPSSQRRRRRPVRSSKRNVELIAPPGVTWQAGVRDLGEDAKTVTLPRSIKRLHATDPVTGGRIEVPIREDAARFTNAPQGRVFFLVKPWARVKLRRRDLGATPFEPVSLANGIYEATFELDDVRKKRSFRVRPGETTTVTVNMR